MIQGGKFSGRVCQHWFSEGFEKAEWSCSQNEVARPGYVGGAREPASELLRGEGLGYPLFGISKKI